MKSEEEILEQLERAKKFYSKMKGSPGWVDRMDGTIQTLIWVLDIKDPEERKKLGRIDSSSDVSIEDEE